VVQERRAPPQDHAAAWWPGFVTLGTCAVAVPLGSLVVTPLLAPVLVTPLGLPWGHVQAGDPMRGVGLAALGVPVIGGSMLATGTVLALQVPVESAWAPFLVGLLAGGWGASVVYTGCVAWDANQTADRLAREQAGASRRR
jgi:hypothetical protein